MMHCIARKLRQQSMQSYKRYEGVGFVTSIPHHNQHLQRRAYTFLDSNKVIIAKSNLSKFPQFRHSTFSSSSSSSSSSSGFVKCYIGMLQTRPFLTKSISSSLIFSAADVTSQMAMLSPCDSYDTIRTLRIAVYGLVIMGPSQHLWFNFLSKMFPGRDIPSTLKKITIGQTIYGPIMNSIFFSYNAALQGETKEDIVARLKRDLLPTLKNGLLYWPLCDFLTFKFIPPHLQPLVNSSFAYLWTIYLTYMASLKKVAEE